MLLDIHSRGRINCLLLGRKLGFHAPNGYLQVSRNGVCPVLAPGICNKVDHLTLGGNHRSAVASRVRPSVVYRILHAISQQPSSRFFTQPSKSRLPLSHYSKRIYAQVVGELTRSTMTCLCALLSYWTDMHSGQEHPMPLPHPIPL